MNATAVETLERRLDATRRALIGEQERLTTARDQAAHAAGYVQQVEDGIRKSEQIIADLTEALDELRGQMEPCPACGAKSGQPCPIPEQAAICDRPADPLDAPCPSCGARPGEPCHSPNGEPVEPHATRGAPT